jgi:hypothetical protein
MDGLSLDPVHKGRREPQKLPLTRVAGSLLPLRVARLACGHAPFVDRLSL